MPVAVVLLVAIALRVAASVVTMIDAMLAGVEPPAVWSGAGAGPGEALLAAGLAAVCWWAAADGVSGIRPVAGIGAALVIVQAVLSAVAAAATIVLIGGSDAARGADLVVRLTWLVVPVVAAGVLIRAATSARARAAGVPAHGGPTERAPGTALEAAPEQVRQAYREPAGWEPDEAAGAVWTSAGDAAAGAPAAGWGSASGGWDARPDDQPQPDRPT